MEDYPIYHPGDELNKKYAAALNLFDTKLHLEIKEMAKTLGWDSLGLIGPLQYIYFKIIELQKNTKKIKGYLDEIEGANINEFGSPGDLAIRDIIKEAREDFKF